MEYSETASAGFQGLNEDMYRFFWEIAFQNTTEFFEANRERYRTNVQQPLQALAARLLPTALTIDPAFLQRVPGLVSRIRRDTRYVKDGLIFRDHAWIGFKHPGEYNSMSFVIYAEFERESYGYGMGMYAPDAAMMQEIRARMLRAPEEFLSLVHDPAFAARFTVEGESYKKTRFSHDIPALIPWLNRKRLTFTFSSPELGRTLTPEIASEIQDALLLMKPVYRFLTGLS